MNDMHRQMLTAIINRSTAEPIVVRNGTQGADIVCASNADRQIARHVVMTIDLYDHVVDWEQRVATGVEYVTTWQVNQARCNAAIEQGKP